MLRIKWVKKSRRPPRDARGRLRLNKRKLRRLYARGRPLKQIAKKFGVCVPTVLNRLREDPRFRERPPIRSASIDHMHAVMAQNAAAGDDIISAILRIPHDSRESSEAKR